MTQQHELFEQYEDAFFALLMDRVAQEEGRKAVARNKLLQEDPEAAVPEVLQKRCMQTVRKAFSAKLRRKTSRVFGKGIHVTAILVLLLAAMLTISCAAFPTIRAGVLNMILEVYETHTSFSFEENRNGAEGLDITADWIPEGFVLIEEGSNSICSWKMYQDENGATVYIEKSLPTTSTIDTEEAQVEEIEIQGNSATLITKGYEARAIWLDKKNNLVFFINTEWLSSETLLEIAEGLK